MSTPLGPLIDSFLHDLERLVASQQRSKATLRQYRSFASHMAPLRDLVPADLTVAEVREWHFQIAEQTRENGQRSTTTGTRTANGALIVLGLVLRRAEEDGVIPRGSSPTRLVRRFRETPRERYLTEPELAALWSAIGRVEAKVVRHAKRPKALAHSTYQALRLILLLGLRKSEALELRWGQVDLVANVLRFPHSKTGYREVAVPAAGADVLRQQLRRRVEGCEWVFPSRVPNKPVRFIYKTWKTVLEVSGVRPEGVVIHGVRHGFATNALRRGTPIAVVSLQLGHKNTKVTQEVYARPYATPDTHELVRCHAAQIVGSR